MSDEQENPQEASTEEATPEVEEGTQKKSSSKKAGLSAAYMGKPFHPEETPERPNRPAWSKGIDNDYFVERVNVQHGDYEDMQAVNRAINQTRFDLFKIRDHVDAARRRVAEAEILHRHAYNRALIGLSGATEKYRIAAAELMAEQEHTNMLVAKVEFEELKNLQFRLSDDLQVLQTLASNLRSQMNLR